MSLPLIGEIRILSSDNVPGGWLKCNGQLVLITDYNNLFNTIGTIYGGDGITDFNIPDLCGKNAINFGTGPGLTDRSIGDTGGSVDIVLNTNQITSHKHDVYGTSAVADNAIPTNTVYMATPSGGRTPPKIYISEVNTVNMHTKAISNTGDDQTHNNMQPYLAMNFIIATEGIDTT